MYNNIGKTSFDFPRSLTTTLKTFPIRLDTPACRLLVFVNFRVYETLSFVVVATLHTTVPLRPKGDFWRFRDFKRGKYSFFSPIPSMQCCAAVRATWRKQQTPQLWMEGTGEECGFFCSFKFPYLSTMFQKFCRRLWGLILVGILSGRLRGVRPYGIAASHPFLDIINSLKSLAAIETIGTSGLQRHSNPWPLRYRCSALPTELWRPNIGTCRGQFNINFTSVIYNYI